DGYRRRAMPALAPLQEAMARHPLAFAHLLCAADFALDVPRELAIIGDAAGADARALRRVASRRFEPNLVIANATPEEAARSESPLLQGRTGRQGQATAYLCERYTCQAPVSEPGQLAALLG
ncbi:MAG TPA: thioredoxin domain-containing protein, partial [Chloroflexota bacterium]|nr:thioredoxin domain-containing protein [Chloroflexota bacterium]